MGLAFAEHLSAYADAKGIEAGTISKIAQNPDQSKHLETATFKLGGLDIDLVNLRSEAYAENSRIPSEVAFGTPLEDAMRRDITINALFYNVHRREVEDFTEKGLDDMKNGLIRTPLPPKETFNDDPLRVLRCIRFASRFGFELVDELKEAARDPKIQDALVSKVARERVGIEIDKMVQGQDPLHSIDLFHQLSLYDPVFFSAIPQDISSTFSEKTFPLNSGLANSTVLDAILKRLDARIPRPHPIYLRHFQKDSTAKPRLYLATALTPYYGAAYVDKKKKKHAAVEAVIRESLKLGVQQHYLDGIPVLFLAVDPVRQLCEGYASFPADKARSTIGVALRNKAIHAPNAGVHWTESFLFSLVLELGSLYDVVNDVFNREEAAGVVERYNSFAELVVELDLYDVGDAVPLLDGREIMKAMDTTKGGPWLAIIQSHIIQWQLDHPQATSESCLSWLEEEKAAGNLPAVTSAGPPSKRPRIK
ncbi:hypothetical protein MD484_g1082, partial [Candolleomyces efflorescens]